MYKLENALFSLHDATEQPQHIFLTVKHKIIFKYV